MPRPRDNPHIAGKVPLDTFVTSQRLAIDVLMVRGHTRWAAARKVALHPLTKDLPP